MSKRSKICVEIKRSLVVGTVGAVSLAGSVACGDVNPIPSDQHVDAGQTEDADATGDADEADGSDTVGQQDSDDAADAAGDDSDDKDDDS